MEIACSRVSCLPARVFGGDFPVTEVDIQCRRAAAFRAARAHQRILQIIKSSTANTIKVMRKSLGPTHPWIKTNMAPLRGWGTRGERLITHVPHGHWQTMTFIGALRHDRIEAPWVLDGPINAEALDGVDRSVRTYGWDPRNSTIKSVCHECNNGWMSSLDDAGKSILSLLIKGEAAFLDVDSQKLIATWVAMKTMVGEFFDPVKAAVPLSERQFLRDRRQPPDNWIIWIGITRETNGLASGSIRLSGST